MCALGRDPKYVCWKSSSGKGGEGAGTGAGAAGGGGGAEPARGGAGGGGGGEASSDEEEEEEDDPGGQREDNGKEFFSPFIYRYRYSIVVVDPECLSRMPRGGGGGVGVQSFFSYLFF